jgi:ankyrin repeat protein
MRQGSDRRSRRQERPPGGFRGLKAGADANSRTSSGDTPLLLAAKSAQSSSAQALIEGGADIQVRDEAGNSVLHYAARSGMTGICGLLIERGIAVDVTGEGDRRRCNSPWAVASRKRPIILFATGPASNRRTARVRRHSTWSPPGATRDS